MNIIFLDIDGVLTYSGYDNSETANIDEKKVKLLAEIANKTEAKIVLISSWRGGFENGSYKHPKIFHTMTEVLGKHGLSIMDIVPYIEMEIMDKCETSSLTLKEISNIEMNPETGRAAEVHKWLKRHPEVTHFVILDDEDSRWDYFGYDTHWIQPSYFDVNGGLSEEHVKQAITILITLKN